MKAKSKTQSHFQVTNPVEYALKAQEELLSAAEQIQRQGKQIQRCQQELDNAYRTIDILRTRIIEQSIENDGLRCRELKVVPA